MHVREPRLRGPLLHAHTQNVIVGGELSPTQVRVSSFAHTQIHSARACAMTDRVNGEGLVSETKDSLRLS